MVVGADKLHSILQLFKKGVVMKLHDNISFLYFLEFSDACLCQLQRFCSVFKIWL